MIIEAVVQLLSDYTRGLSPRIPSHPGLSRVVTSQLQIRLHMLPRGFLSLEWKRILQDFSVVHPSSKVSGLLCCLWVDFTFPIWCKRNELLHRQDNLYRQSDSLAQGDRLRWYLRNSHVLSRTDQFLLRFTEEDIHRMPGLARTGLLRTLDIARDAISMESMQREKGQRVITSYFHPSRGIG